MNTYPNFALKLVVMVMYLRNRKQEGLAVARIAQDDGSSSTNLSPAVTRYALFRYALYARRLRKSRHYPILPSESGIVSK